METKEQRRERQNKAYRKMINQLKVDVAKSYTMKAQKDAFYINFSNIVEQCV